MSGPIPCAAWASGANQRGLESPHRKLLPGSAPTDQAPRPNEVGSMGTRSRSCSPGAAGFSCLPVHGAVQAGRSHTPPAPRGPAHPPLLTWKPASLSPCWSMLPNPAPAGPARPLASSLPGRECTQPMNCCGAHHSDINGQELSHPHVPGHESLPRRGAEWEVIKTDRKEA